MAIAGRQQAKALELRAATSLARFRIEQGRAAEGLASLQQIYSSFTEGFETGDLREARELLGQFTVSADSGGLD